MAGSGTAPRRWIVPSALLTVLLASYGGDNFIATMQGAAGRGKCWRCPKCNRVEWREEGGRPWCRGTEGHQHDPARTNEEKKKNTEATDKNYYFYIPR